jgi:ribonucleoside-triphosphate reductase
MFDSFYFPDGTQPHWEAVSWLQKRYMKWLNKERTKTLLTFPVMTVCLLTDGKDVLDKEYKDLVTTQWAEGDSFFVYLSQNADSISSCCRLRNEITENTFSSTTGLTGVQTGSCNVMTLNLNRIVQDWWNSPNSYEDDSSFITLHRKSETEMIVDAIRIDNKIKCLKGLEAYLKAILDRVYDYQIAYKTGLYKMDKQGMFPQTKAGYISLDKLYCTIGVNGLNEAARFLGLEVSNNKDYMDFVSFILGTIKDYNKQHSTKRFMFNLELVPAESLGVKNYNWDKADGYWVPDDENLYNSYIYDAHDNTSILDKISMQGGKVAKSIDGGQASHLNLEDNLSKEQYTKLLEYAVREGNSYITFNVPQTQCDDCGFIAKHPFYECPKCGSTKTTKWTRIIGYLRPMKAWSEARQEEGSHRMFAKKENAC